MYTPAYPCKPLFFYIEVGPGFKGLYFSWTCFPDDYGLWSIFFTGLGVWDYSVFILCPINVPAERGLLITGHWLT